MQPETTTLHQTEHATNGQNTNHVERQVLTILTTHVEIVVVVIPMKAGEWLVLHTEKTAEAVESSTISNLFVKPLNSTHDHNFHLSTDTIPHRDTNNNPFEI